MRWLGIIYVAGQRRASETWSREWRYWSKDILWHRLLGLANVLGGTDWRRVHDPASLIFGRKRNRVGINTDQAVSLKWALGSLQANWRAANMCPGLESPFTQQDKSRAASGERQSKRHVLSLFFYLIFDGLVLAIEHVFDCSSSLYALSSTLSAQSIARDGHHVPFWAFLLIYFVCLTTTTSSLSIMTSPLNSSTKRNSDSMVRVAVRFIDIFYSHSIRNMTAVKISPAYASSTQVPSIDDRLANVLGLASGLRGPSCMF
ncbi:hypothetical protein EDD85DRAFT_943553 [Armillaria nabsnona]|nr:hypothetical protein EDD85DRAFT_943553 [Armillaria nabsnona]